MTDNPIPAADGEGKKRKDQEHATPRPAVDTSRVLAGYANFCRVTGTPEEVLLDFGLNEQPFGEQERPVQITHRIVLNFYTAKRMLAALQMTVQRHEQVYGRLEVDVRKRVTPRATSE